MRAAPCVIAELHAVDGDVADENVRNSNGVEQCVDQRRDVAVGCSGRPRHRIRHGLERPIGRVDAPRGVVGRVGGRRAAEIGRQAFTYREQTARQFRDGRRRRRPEQCRGEGVERRRDGGFLCGSGIVRARPLRTKMRAGVGKCRGDCERRTKPIHQRRRVHDISQRIERADERLCFRVGDITIVRGRA